jgi:hypothetical protein
MKRSTPDELRQLDDARRRFQARAATRLSSQPRPMLTPEERIIYEARGDAAFEQAQRDARARPETEEEHFWRAAEDLVRLGRTLPPAVVSVIPESPGTESIALVSAELNAAAEITCFVEKRLRFNPLRCRPPLVTELRPKRGRPARGIERAIRKLMDLGHTKREAKRRVRRAGL